MDCLNCSSPFTEANLPKLLIACGHTICNSCIQKLFSQQRIICPDCKQENPVVSISQIPTNQALLNLNLSLSPKESGSSSTISHDFGFPTFKRFSTVVESPKSSKKITSQKCLVHNKNIEAFCLQDLVGLCIDCILSDNYKNKEVLSIDKATNILQEKLRKDSQSSLDRERRFKRALETLEKQEKSLIFLKKRNEEEIRAFFEDFHRFLHEKEQKSLESNAGYYNQAMIQIKTSRKSNEDSLNLTVECNKLYGILSSGSKVESNTCEVLNTLKSINQIRARIIGWNEGNEEPSHENFIFDKENEIKSVIQKLRESCGESWGREKSGGLCENVNQTVCYSMNTNTSDDRRGLNNVSMMVRPSNHDKENTSPTPISVLPSKSNSPFSLEKKNIKTTKSVNFKNFSSNAGFENKHSPNVKINRAKSPVINQRKLSKPENISYSLMRKLKTDLEDNPILDSNTSMSKGKKPIYSINSLTQKLSINTSNSEIKEINRSNNKITGCNFVKKAPNLDPDSRKHYKIYTLGGFSQDKQFSIEEYDSKSKDWTLKFTSAINKAKFGSVIYNNSIILFGGKSDGKRLNSFYKYDCLSTKMTEINMKLSVSKSGFGYCIREDEIFVCGGNDGTSILDSFESYNLRNFSIRKLPSMNYKRDELALVLDPKNNCIYAIGGYCNQNNCLNSVEKFDFKLNKWFMIANLVEPRRSLNAVMISNSIYAIGGFNGFQYLNSVEKYDVLKDKWISVKPMKESRCTFSALALNEEGCFIVMGGFNNAPLSSCEIYNEKKENWDDFKGLEMKRFMHSCNLLYLDTI